MSDNELLRKMGLSAESAKRGGSDTDEELKGRCFGFLRGQRDRALNIEFRRLKAGDSITFPYSWLGPTRFDPNVGVLLVFAASETYGVRIRGRNLNTLQPEGFSFFERGLLRQRVTFVTELDQEASRAAGTECIVERIEIEPLPADRVASFLGFEAERLSP